MLNASRIEQKRRRHNVGDPVKPGLVIETGDDRREAYGYRS
jgi:hypothetical protein